MAQSTDMERRLEKVEDTMQSLVVVQAEQNVILKTVIDYIKTERSNSGRIGILENNWKWAKGILVIEIAPILFLLLKTFLP